MDYLPQIGNPSTNNYKKMLRKAVRMIRWLNKQMADNKIWCGRFIYKLERVEYFHYSTKDFPAEMKCLIGFYDKQTKTVIYERFFVDEYFITLVCAKMSGFVTELVYTKFGEEAIKPSTIDWTQIKVPVKDFEFLIFYQMGYFSMINPTQWKDRGYV